MAGSPRFFAIGALCNASVRSKRSRPRRGWRRARGRQHRCAPPSGG